MIDAIEPRLPGVTIQVHISAADQLVVENPTTTELAVVGEQGEPFLRIGPDGAFANTRSPTWYRSNDPTGSFPVPPQADPLAPPEWARVSREPAWGWFDHRLHRAALTAAPAGDGPVTLERWRVPMRYGEREVVVRGRRIYSVPRGAFTSAVTEQLPGAEATVLAGRMPVVFLRLAGARELTLFEDDGTPIARLGPQGAEVNEASPTWALTAAVRTGRRPDAAGGPGPVWRRLDPTPQLAWLELRARYPQAEPPENLVSRRAVVKRWRVPAQVDGRRSTLAGSTTWVPAGHDQEQGGFPWWPVVAGAALLALAGAAVVSQRSRAR